MGRWRVEMTTDTIKHLGAEFHCAADSLADTLARLDNARLDRLTFLRRCSKDSTARLAAIKEELRTLPEQIAKWDAEAARLESQTAEDLLRQALDPAPREPSPNRFDCESCGTGVSADEDGCCATCGQTCWQWVNGECVLAGGAEPEEAMADEAEKPTLIDLTKLPPGTVCEAVAAVFSENLSSQMPAGTRFVIKEHASDGDALVESLDARQMWVRRLQPARVVKEGGER